MASWVLIAIFVASTHPVVIEFNSVTKCENAGKHLSAVYDGYVEMVRWACVER